MQTSECFVLYAGFSSFAFILSFLRVFLIGVFCKIQNKVNNVLVINPNPQNSNRRCTTHLPDARIKMLVGKFAVFYEIVGIDNN